ncbi:MAG: STN domain-containing protein, partial [Zoogloea sp.]|uniref:STN domain-containing protein n=1 Tax=Zoogloea sp. TaxID=49181 RepID=UPI002618E2D3
MPAHRLLLPLPLLLAACASHPPELPSSSHLRAAPRPSQAQPTPGRLPDILPLAPPTPAARLETYSVVVTAVRVQDLLFALARDARINIDIHPGLTGTVTLNAIDQTLPQILDRLARQVDLRYEINGRSLAVMPDTPFLRSYRLDYVNLNRSVTGTVSTNTQIGTSGTGSLAG